MRHAGVMYATVDEDVRLLHICSAAQWARAQAAGEYRPRSLAESGFIHLSTPSQVHLPANRLYRGRCDLVLLSVEGNRLTSPVRWEAGDPGDPESMEFPHLYGPLPTEAVTAVTVFRPGPDGLFEALVPGVL